MRNMYWADIVPLGHFATWACEPNQTLDEIQNMLEYAYAFNFPQIIEPCEFCGCTDCEPCSCGAPCEHGCSGRQARGYCVPQRGVDHE